MFFIDSLNRFSNSICKLNEKVDEINEKADLLQNTLHQIADDIETLRECRKEVKPQWNSNQSNERPQN